MRLLLDTQIVIWVATGDPRLTGETRSLILGGDSEIVFSVASLWEIAIKAARGKPDFRHAARDLRDAALAAGWEELPVSGEHALGVADLPGIHGDPFDRLLVAQARLENALLLSADRTLWSYGDPVRRA
jgi:PIN domain nuclease of toxin-antitoxin system